MLHLIFGVIASCFCLFCAVCYFCAHRGYRTKLNPGDREIYLIVTCLCIISAIAPWVK